VLRLAAALSRPPYHRARTTTSPPRLSVLEKNCPPATAPKRPASTFASKTPPLPEATTAAPSYPEKPDETVSLDGVRRSPPPCRRAAKPLRRRPERSALDRRGRHLPRRRPPATTRTPHHRRRALLLGIFPPKHPHRRRRNPDPSSKTGLRSQRAQARPAPTPRHPPRISISPAPPTDDVEPSSMTVPTAWPKSSIKLPRLPATASAGPHWLDLSSYAIRRLRIAIAYRPDAWRYRD